MNPENEIKKIIFKFLNPKEYQAFIFGSRATGKARKYSDYDIGVWGKKPLPAMIKFLIKDALEESDLPFKVEIVDFSLVADKFKKVALSKTKKL